MHLVSRCSNRKSTHIHGYHYSPAVLTPLFLVANGSGRPDTLINGLFFNDQEIVNRGIIITLDSSGDFPHSRIEIPATIENNSTSIQCLLGSDLSPIGKFFVQGKLAE